MNTHRIALLILLSCSIFLTSCSWLQVQPEINHENIEGDQVLGAEAETRFLILNQRRGSHIFCAEPSPDIMKAVQESFAMASKLAASDASKSITGDLAFELSKTHAEAAAQLGERLATIQLLRDSLYRACEAYANGAIDKTAYAVLLSRYDDVMVTLLMGELAAGNFGRKLATVGGSARSQSNLKKVFENVTEAQKTEDTKKENLTALKKELKTKEEELKKAKKNKPDDDHSVLEGKVKDLKEKVKKAEDEAESAENNTTFSQVKAVATAAEALSVTQNKDIAEILARIQRKYIENINSDALVVACVTELSDFRNQDPKNETELFKLCKGETGILKTILKGQSELLKAYLTRTFLFIDDTKIDKIEEKKKNINKIFNLFACDSQNTECPKTKHKKPKPKHKKTE